MSSYEKINQLFNEVKNASLNEITIKFTPIFELFSLLKKEEKDQISSDFYKWAEENAKQQPVKFAYAKYMVALNDLFKDRYDSAISTVSEAQKIFLEQNDETGVAICSLLIGTSFRTLGSLDLALKEFWEAYDQLKKSGVYPHNIMACSFQIAGTYLEMKQYDDALPLFQKTFEMADRLDIDLWRINSLQGLGKTYLMQKKYPEAKISLDHAMEIAEKLKLHRSIATTLSDLGHYYYDINDLSQSEKLHKESLEIREQNNLIGGAITDCIRLGEIYMKSSKPEEAISVLLKGLKLAEDLKVKPKISQIHFLLSEIYQSKSEIEKSLFHYKLFHKIREEVEKEDAAKKIKNIQLVFEAEQTKKENIIIKKQKKEIENKNIELQETIDELTRTKVGKKAKAFTLIIAIVLFLLEELILHQVTHLLPEDNFYLSLGVKMLIIFSLKPIDSAVEHYLLKKIIKKEKKQVLV
jgi:tetratricopeptide (TPR) repeat protein